MSDSNRVPHRAAARSRLIIGVAALVGLLVFVWAENTFAQNFQACISQQASNQAAKNANGRSEVTGGFLGRQFVCSVGFLDKHAGFVGALAGIAVALFTWALWQSTERLWLEAQQQRDHAGKVHRAELKAHGEALAVAQKTADAAFLTANNLLRSTRPFCVMQNIWSEPFEGPVSDLDKWGGYPIASIFGKIKNVGTAAAFMINMGATASIRSEESPSLEEGGQTLSFGNEELTGGASFDPLLPICAAPFPEDPNGTLFVWGWIRYADIHGIVRRSGFAFEYFRYADELRAMGMRDAFHRYGDRSYWYDREEGPET